MDALTASNLEDTLRLEKKHKATSEENWDKMNQMACGLIRSCLIQDIKYHVLHETSARQLWEILEKKYLTKSIESCLQLKRRFYRFQMKRRLSIDEQMNNYTKLLIDLSTWMWRSKNRIRRWFYWILFLKEYETFTLTLINGRQILNYSEVSIALVNYKVRRQDKLSSSGSTSAEALVIKGRSSNRKGKGDRERSKSRRGLKKNPCAFYKELGHWKIDYPKVKGKKKESKTEANLAEVVSTHASTSHAGGSDSDSSLFSFSVTTSIIGYSGDSEWMLDIGATYHVCSNMIDFLALRS